MNELTQNVLVWTGLTLVLAAAVHFAVVLAIPWAVGMRLYKTLAAPNTVMHGEKTSAANNPVRRASPDLIYSGCAYNLSDGPLRITASVPPMYMSVSCYALNTDNFYTKNDGEAQGHFDLVLVGPADPLPTAPGSDVVRSPTTTGGVLFRYFLGDGAREEQIECCRREIQIVRFRQGG